MLANYFKNKKQNNPFFLDSNIQQQKDRKIDLTYYSRWKEEDLFLSKSGDKETIGRNFNFKRLPLASFVLYFLILIIFFKVAYLQIIMGDYYSVMAEENRIRIKSVDPQRGIIYDKNLIPLIKNTANFTLYLIPNDFPEKTKEQDKIFQEIFTKELAKNISIVPEIKKKLEEIKKYSYQSYQPLLLAENIKYEQAMDLYLKSTSWSGIILSNKDRREYLSPLLKVASSTIAISSSTSSPYFHSSLAHILGYTAKINKQEYKNFKQKNSDYRIIDKIGKTGLEYYWEKELKGKLGKKKIEVDALGKEKKVINQIDPQNGYNLILTIDLKIQKKLEEILINHLYKLNLKKASAIILNPQNGEVIALVSLPSYDNNLFAKGISYKDYQKLINNPYDPLFNRSISGEYPPGSVIKLVMASAGLQDELISEHTSFQSTGGLKISQWYFPDWKNGGHGITDVRKAIAESVNTFFYCLGGGCDNFSGLGVERIKHYYSLFNLGKKTNIDLNSESKGFIPDKEWKRKVKNEKWYIGDTYHLSIGQGDLLTTPLQVALWTSFFANQGKLYQPHLVKKFLNNNNQVIRTILPKTIKEDFINPVYIKIIKQGMRKTITEGSAKDLQNLPKQVAGKTGTAQWSSIHQSHAWFTGFAPYQNPEIVITILIEQGGEGSKIAVPIAKEFFEWYFKEY